MIRVKIKLLTCTYILSLIYMIRKFPINRGGKIFVFNWYYSPQGSGTYKQKETYQRQCIDNMVERIIKTKKPIKEILLKKSS